MDVQEKLIELLDYHVGLKKFYSKKDNLNEIKRHTQFIIVINQTRIEMKLLREQNEEQQRTIKMIGEKNEKTDTEST